MQLLTLILSVSILATPLPNPNAVIEGIKNVANGAKKVAGVVWAGTKIAAVGATFGGGATLGINAADRYMDRKFPVHQQQSAPEEEQSAPLPPLPIATDE
jgi:hypothetical protein